MAGITYDAGALIAAERNDRRMWALHAGFLAEEVAPVVPVPVLAEAWRGGARQANAGQSGHENVVDVTVVHGAISRGDAVVTSNREDIEKVGQAVGLTLRIEEV
jgi:hypothetical protein